VKPLKLTPVLLFAILFSNFSFAQSGWIKLDPNHSITRNLVNIKIFDSNNFYIFADSNYIIKSSDGGVTLLQQPWNFSTTAVYFRDMNTGYAMKGKILWKTQNAGITWDSISNLTSFFSGQHYGHSGLNFVNDNMGYISVSNGGIQWNETRILFTTDGGYTWSQAGANSYSSGSGTYYTSESISDFNMLSQNTGYYVKHTSVSSQFGQGPESYALYKTSNHGANWENIGSNINALKIYGANFTNENTGYAAVDSSRFFKTIDGGQTWELRGSIPATLKLYMIDEMNGYTIDWEQYYRTTDGGISWTLQNLGYNAPIYYSNISFLNSQIGYIVSMNGLILKTTSGGTVSIGNNNFLTADKYSLSQNYPNPFNPETKINFSIPKNGLVKIIMYDMLGREVKELVNEFKQQGSYNVSFNGASLSSGIYFYKLITNDFAETKKMILVK